MKELDPKTYEHPADRATLNVLKKIPLIDKLGAFILNMHTKFADIVEYRGCSVEVTEKSVPRVYRLKSIAAERLCMNMDIPMFIKLDWEYNAFATGVDYPFIVLHSGLVENLTDDELTYIIGHEMGHIKSKHMLYHWMARNVSVWLFKQSIIGGLALQGLLIALLEWERKSELTSDRAGYIACRNKDATITGMMKLMGLPENYESSSDWNFTVDSVLGQLSEHEDFKADSLYNKLMYALVTMKIDHPWTIERIREIRGWEFESF